MAATAPDRANRAVLRGCSRSDQARTGFAAVRPVAELAPEQYAAMMDRWTNAAAATWNRHLSAPVSFTTWAQRQDMPATNVR